MCTIGNALLAQQLTITTRSQLSNNFGVKDFWNLDLVKPDEKPMDIQLRVTLQSLKGKILVEAVSNPITLTTRFTGLNAQMVVIKNLQFYDNEAQRSNQTTGSLPAGDYQYCIYALNNITGEIKAQQCINITIRNLTPPVLIYPFNAAIIQEKNPLLTWLSPGANTNGLSINYTLKLIELYPKQTAIDGLLRNRPLLYQNNITTTSLQYPFNAPVLAYGKSYAWQVEAYDGSQQPVGVSEMWSFTLLPDSAKAAEAGLDQSYIDITEGAPNAVYYAKGVLKIKYNTRQYPSRLTYQVIDANENIMNRNESLLMALTKENWYDIDMETNLNLKHGQRYRFELFDGKNNYNIYFTYLNPIRTK